MKIGFIGSGKVGASFGFYLKQSGFDISGYFDTNTENLNNAVNLTNSKSFDSYDGILNSSDILFLTVNDDAINVVSKDISKLDVKNKIFVHMSGAKSSDELIEIKDNGGYCYSLHPIQAFATVDKAIELLPSTYFSLEGDEEKLDVLKSIMDNLKNNYFIMDKRFKSVYHASACVASNYLCSLMDMAVKMFKEAGASEQFAFEALKPLIYGTLSNIESLGAKDALTGPIARGDVGTVKTHVNSLSQTNKNLLNQYKFLGNMTLELAKQKKLTNTENIDGLFEALK